MTCICLRSALTTVYGERVVNHLICISLFQKECKKRNSLMFRTFSFSISIHIRYSGCLKCWRHKYLSNMLYEKQSQKTSRNHLFLSDVNCFITVNF